MKNVGQLTSKFDLDQSEGKSTQVHARPGQMKSQVDISFQLSSNCESIWPGRYTTASSTRINRITILRKAYLEHLKVVFIVPQIVQKFHVFFCPGSNL